MNIIDLSYRLNESFENVTLKPKPVIVKGAATINISLIGINEDRSAVDVVTIDWGDGSREVKKRDLFFNYRKQSIFNEVLYGKINGSPLGVFSHEYVNKYNTYEATYSIQIAILKNTGQYIYIKQPVRCFWASFYDSVVRLATTNTQILPTKSNDTFLNLVQKDGTIIPASLRETGTPLLQGGLADIEPLDLLGFMEPGFLATSDSIDIEITLESGETYFVDITLGFEEFDIFTPPTTPGPVVPDEDGIISFENEQITTFNSIDIYPLS
jgi:hypothetical protein